MRPETRRRVLVPIAVLALLAASVGALAFAATPGEDGPVEERSGDESGTGSETGTAKPLSLAAWRRQANAICAELNEHTGALRAPGGRREAAALVPQALDAAEAALADLRALTPPPARRARVERMLRLFARFVALERRAVQALSAGDAAAYSRLNARAFALEDRGNVIARRLRVRECARGGSDESELARALERNRVVVVVVYTPESPVDRLAIREARAGAASVDAGFVPVDAYDPSEIAPIATEYPVRQAPAVLVFTRLRGAVKQFPGYVDRETVAQAVDDARTA